MSTGVWSQTVMIVIRCDGLPQQVCEIDAQVQEPANARPQGLLLDHS